MGLTISASVPKVFYILLVLKLQPVGVGRKKTYHLATSLPGPAGKTKTVDEAWKGTSRPARLTAIQRHVPEPTLPAEKLWWRF